MVSIFAPHLITGWIGLRGAANSNLRQNNVLCRYIRCSSAVSVAHLKKLIHAKYELTDQHKVDVFFKEDNLDSALTLIDVAYIYSWKRVCFFFSRVPRNVLMCLCHCRITL